MKTSFNERCYRILRRVPKGRVTTYAEIARVLKSTGFRAVGNAMNKNPYAPKVPCHRVVRSTGELGGFAGGATAKARLLTREGVIIKKGMVVDFERVFFRFSRS